MPDVSSIPPEAGTRVTLVGLFANIALAGVKFVAGVFAGSQALVADAVHSLSDLFTDVVVLFGLSAGRKKADVTHHFGHARVETMSSAVVAVILVAAAVYIGWEAGATILRGNPAPPGWVAAVAAMVSIGVKEALYHYTVNTGKKLHSRALVANAWHHRSDALSSVAVAIGVAGARIRDSWAVLDAWAAVLVALLVLKVGLSMFSDALSELMDRAPEPEVIRKIARVVRDTPGVMGMHDLKVRSSADRYQMQAHIVVDCSLTVAEGHAIVEEVEARLFAEFPSLAEVVLHMDPCPEDQRP
ncbi:MAG: cation transporter [Deltaproteobacteria bacterium]|nr:cation transporter [Deltaproteobacteria bacterium]